jgi:hypothetical protein
MRYTRSQARSQAVEEAQVSLLQAVATHTSSLENLEISTPLPTILEDVPLEPVIACHVSISTVAVPPVPSSIHKKTRLPPTSCNSWRAGGQQEGLQYNGEAA